MEISQDPLPLLPSAEQKSSAFQVALNLFKSSLGIGILALPYCFTESGIFLSAIFMFPIAILTVYTVFKTVELAEIKGLKETNFRELYIDYVGNRAVFCFEVCMTINYFGVGVSYVIFFIDFFKNAFHTTGLLYSLMYGGLSLIIIIPLSLIRKLEFFTKYSAIANILTILVLCVLIEYPLSHLDAENVQNYGNIGEIPGLLGVALFAFVSPGLVIPMRNSMEKKEKFKATFFIVIIIVFIIYVGWSVVCCFGFRQSEMTQNILRGFGNINEYFLLTQGCYALVLVVTYPMQLGPLFDVIENIESIKFFLERNQEKWLYRNSVRIIISVMIFPFGIFVSKFADFINLLGAMCFFVIQFIYPLWAYNVCFEKNIGKTEKWINYSLVFISFIAVLLSSYNSIWSFMYR